MKVKSKMVLARILLMISCFAVNTSQAMDGAADGDIGGHLHPGIAELTGRIRAAHEDVARKIAEIPADVTRVVVLGVTGVGKGVFIHALAGRQLVSKRGMGKMMVDVSSEDQRLPGVLIKHGGRGTTEPVFFHDEGNRLVYCDFPGFMDPQGPEENIINALTLDSGLREAPRVKVLLLAEESEITSARAQGIRDRLDRLCTLFPRRGEIERGISLVVTKGERAFPGLEVLQGHIQTEVKEGRAVHPFVSFLASRPDLVSSFPKPGSGAHGLDYVFEGRAALIASLRTPPVLNPTVRIHLDDPSILCAGEVMRRFEYDMMDSISSLANEMVTEYWNRDSRERLRTLQDAARRDKNTTEALESLQTEERSYLERLQAFIDRLPGTPDTLVPVLESADFLGINVNTFAGFLRVTENIPFGRYFFGKMERSNMNSTEREFRNLRVVLDPFLNGMRGRLQLFLEKQKRAHISYKTDISLVWSRPGRLGFGEELTPWLEGIKGAVVGGFGGAVVGGVSGASVGALAGVVTAAISALEDDLKSTIILKKDNVKHALGYCREFLERTCDPTDTVMAVIEAIKKAEDLIDKLDDSQVKIAVKCVFGAALGVAATYGGAKVGRCIGSWLGDGPYARAIQDAGWYGGGAGGGVGAVLGKLEAETGLVSGVTVGVPVIGPVMAAIAAIPDKRVKAIAMGGFSGGLFGGVVGLGAGVYHGFNNAAEWANNFNIDLIDSDMVSGSDFSLLLKTTRLDGYERAETVSSMTVDFKPAARYKYDMAYGKYSVRIYGDGIAIQNPATIIGDRLLRTIENVEGVAPVSSPYVTVHYPASGLDLRRVIEVVDGVSRERDIYKYRGQQDGTGNGLTISMEILRRLSDVIHFPLPDLDPRMPPLSLQQRIVDPLRRVYEEIEARPLPDRQGFIEGNPRRYRVTVRAGVSAGTIVAGLEELKMRILGDLHHLYCGGANSHVWLKLPA